jgi:peptidoglycan/xylan/chitin deacetylase (PgdA/CDA1 family)
MLHDLKQVFPCALMLFAVVVSCSAGTEKSPVIKIAIIKADDVRGPTEKWDRFIKISKERNVKVSCGIICGSLAGATEEYKDWLVANEKSGFVEFWNHGWDHKAWEQDGKKLKEFDGSGYDHQKEHFVKSQEIVQQVLGHPPLAFGTPFNRFDEDTVRVLKEDTAIKLVFFKEPKIAGIIPAGMSLLGEQDGVGQPNATKFAAQYAEKKDLVDFTAIQFHPNGFKEDHHFDDYAEILDILLKDGWTFMLPREYAAWLAEKNKN